MLGAIRNWLIYRAINRALKHPMPRQFFTSGEQANVNHFFQVTFNDDEAALTFYVDKLTEHGADGVVRSKFQTGGLPGASLPYRQFENLSLRIKHYYRGYEITYSSPVRFFWAEFANYAYWHRRRDIRLQKEYNQQQLVRQDRIQVLSHFLNRTIADRTYANSSIGLITELYGTRWVLHPDEANIQSYYGLIMESLKSSGDLETVQSSYCRITPRALSTLDTYAEEKARHTENTAIQRKVVSLTIVLAIIAAVQVAASIWEEFHPDPADISATTAVAPSR